MKLLIPRSPCAQPARLPGRTRFAIARVTELMWSKITGGQLFQSPPKSTSWSEPFAEATAKMPDAGVVCSAAGLSVERCLRAHVRGRNIQLYG